MKKFSLLPVLWLVFIFFFSGCKKDPDDTPPSEEVSVYVTGGVKENTMHAYIWKDGEPQQLSDGINNTLGYALYVDNNKDVYVAGLSYPNSSTYYGRVWKNGEILYSSGNEEALFLGIDGKDDDIYIAGAKKISGNYQATLWKNGMEITLPHTSLVSYATSVAVSDGNIIAAGYEVINRKTVATVWFNNSVIHLADSLNNSRALSVKVDNNTIYVAGYISNGANKVAMVWRNYTPVPLTDGTSDATASDIFLDGNDVYVSGYRHTGTYQANYWKNGTPYILGDSTVHTYARSIYVYEDDVYCTGWQFENTNRYLKLWKNQEEIPLPDMSSDYTIAMDVMVK